MTKFYEVSIAQYSGTLDMHNYQYAIALIEECGGGNMVAFRRERNVSGCLPEFVEKSCGSACFEDGQWRGSIAPKKEGQQ